MAEDIVPGLLDKIEKRFQNLMAEDAELQSALKAVQNGSTSYTDALNYADRVGQMLAQALKSELTTGVLPDDTLYYNITQRIVNQTFGEAYDLGEAAAVRVQKAINQTNGLGMSAITDESQKAAELNDLINTVSGKKIDEADGEKLFTAAEKVSLNGVSDTMEANADFQGGAGLKPKIYRRAAFGCCAWCSAMSGTYDYPNVPHDVYRRHENCRCTVEYDPGTGRRQNVHTKQWTEPNGAAIINGNTSQIKDEVERATQKAKGSPMSIADALSGANPNYSPNTQYGVNCQRCVQAYELRRRGYDVTAKPKPKSGNTISWGSECFIPQGSDQNQAYQAYTMWQSSKDIANIVSSAPDGARFSIYTAWKSGDAHVFVAEKEAGVVRYLDPQCGSRNAKSYFARGKEGHFGYFRMDDKQITTDIGIIQETVERA